MSDSHKELFNGLCAFCDAFLINNMVYIKLFNRGERGEQLIERLMMLEKKSEYIVILDIRELHLVNSLDISTILNLNYAFKDIYIVVGEHLAKESIFIFFNITPSQYKIVTDINDILELIDESKPISPDCSNCIMQKNKN